MRRLSKGRLFLSVIAASIAASIVAAAGPTLAAPPAAKPFGAEVGRDQIDLHQCRVFHDGTPAAADEPRLLHALGGPPPAQNPWVHWSAGEVAG